jgi:hypothetical protein
MATILAQMRGYAVSAGRQRHLRRAQRIGQGAAARIAQSGDVINVHAKPDFWPDFWPDFRRRTHRLTFRARRSLPILIRSPFRRY